MPPTAPAPAPASLRPALPGVFALISEGIALYRERLNVLLSLGALSMVAEIALSVVAPKNAHGVSDLHYGLAGIVILIVAVILLVWLNLARIMAIVESGMAGVGESMHTAGSRFWGYVWVSILTGTAILGSLVLFVGVPAGIIAFLSWKFAGGAAFVVVAVLAAIAALVTIAIVGTWLSLSIWVWATGMAAGTDALRQSRALVRGRVGNVFWRWVGISLVTLIATLPIYAITALIAAMAPGEIGYWIGTLFTAAYTALLISPINLATAYSFFRHLR